MGRRAAGLALLLTFLASAVVGPDRGAGASPTASRLIDRTFRCLPVALSGGLRAVNLDAVPIGANEPYDPRQARSPGFIGAASGGRGPDAELVSVRARGWQRFAVAYSDEGVYASRGRCTPARFTVPLSPKGLPGPAVRWAAHETCLLRGRLLIRIRATLQSAASWGQQPSGPYDGARRNVVEAALAIRSERTGAPLAYLELERDGGTRFWYSRACTG